MHRVSVLAAALAMSSLALADVSLTGTVQDPSHSAIAGAQVTLQRGRTSLKTGTGPQGEFIFRALQPGEYSLSVQFLGFSLHQQKVKLGTSQPLPIEVTLSLESMKQELTIEGQGEFVNTDPSTNRSAVTVSGSLLESLPVFDQDYIATMSRFLDQGATATGGVTLVVDGVEANGVGVSPSAIQSVQINNDPYSAVFSRPGRGRIEVLTKASTPQYHGTLNFLFRDQHLNARDAFAVTRPPEQRRIYEGSVTGPLFNPQKNGFLISFDRQELDQQAIIYAQTPTGLFRGNLDAPVRRLFVSGRASHAFSDTNSLWIGYSYEDRYFKNQGAGDNVLPEAAQNSEFREDEITLSHRALITPHLAHQLRFLVGRFDAPFQSVTDAPKIIVPDAFTAGGAQADLHRTERHWDGTELLTYSKGRHVVKFGIDVPDWSRRGITNRREFLGVYSYASLADYSQGRWYSFTQQAGSGHLTFLEKVFGPFVQDQIQVTPNFSVSIGLRYYFQNYFHNDPNNFAPRLALAWSPGKSRKTVIRAGGGMFYDRTGPQPIVDSLLYDGVLLRRYVVTGTGLPSAPSIVRLDPALHIPYTMQYSAGVERQVSKAATLSVTWIGVRGVDLFRSRDANAPFGPLYLARPDPAFSQIRQIESAGRMTSDSLEISFRGRLGQHFTGLAQYTLAKAENNTSGVTYFPADSTTWAGEWGRADFDQRHRFNLLGSLTGWKWANFGAAVSAASPAPVDETTGRDDNHDGLALDRPAGVTRNTLQGPAYLELDLRWSRDFKLSPRKEGPVLTVAADAFNVTNNVNYTTYIGNLSSPFFGQAVSSQPARRMQLGLRFKF